MEDVNLLTRLANKVLRHLAIAQIIKSKVGEEHFHVVYSEDLVLQPKATLQALCEFLGIHCSEQFYERCGSILYESPNQIRALVNWPQEVKDNITQRLKQNAVLQRYSFEN